MTTEYKIAYGSFNEKDAIEAVNMSLVINDISDKNINTVRNNILNKGYRLVHSTNYHNNETIKIFYIYHDMYNIISKLPNIPTYKNGYNKVMLAKPIYNVKNLKERYIAQPKYNGLRFHTKYIKSYEKAKDIFDKDKVVKRVLLMTREGNYYKNDKIENAFIDLYDTLIDNCILDKNTEVSFDGEIYYHGMDLQDIRKGVELIKEGYVNRTKAINKDLVYPVIYDLKDIDLNQYDRINLLLNMFKVYYNYYIEDITITSTLMDVINNNSDRFIKFSYSIILTNDMDTLQTQLLPKYINYGFEGLILRELNSKYKYGSRTSSLIKVKPLYDGEFKIIDILDKGEKNNKINITFLLINDINNEYFECTPGDREHNWNNNKKKHYLETKSNYIGKYAYVKHYSRSKKGIPTHANVVKIIDTNEKD